MVTKSTNNGRGSVWIISESKTSAFNLNSIGESNISGPVKEYKISELALYLLNPDPIVIQDKLVGCYITYKKSGFNKFKNAVLAPFTTKKDDNQKKDPMTREYVSALHMKTYTFRDQNFENHFKRIYKALRPYDSLLRIISTMDDSKIQDITGICEDIAGNRYKLDLTGTVRDKLNYMTTYLLTPVKITMKRAYLTKGLFELRGYKFETFNPENSYRLIRFYQNGKTAFCVLGSGEKKGFFVEDSKLVYWLQLLEQSLRTNDKLAESVNHCVKGEARPFKLFFTRQLEFSYSQNHLPQIFRNNYDVSRMAPEDKNAIAETLNNQQRVISFNYIPHSNTGEEKMYTNISVMHDFKALEPLKDHFPNLYNEISENAPASDAGKFYLLDAIKGCQDE
ncbi:MAG: hypothetical protein WC799_01165 [Desulfobacteraceae bacterium]|jgi:hypothetical protein